MAQIRLSASRLINFLGCEHYAALWLAGVKPPEEEDASLDLLREKGLEHEAAVLKTLEAKYGTAVSIPVKASLEERSRLTGEAIAAGAPLIFQGALHSDTWVGFPDFLVKSGTTSDGRSTYEPEDAKLARRAKPEHLLQLGVYAELLEQNFALPRFNGTIHVARNEPQQFDLRHTQYVTKRLVSKFEAFAKLKVHETEPRRCSACGMCPYSPKCEAEWRAVDSAVFVAGMTGDQLLKLEKAGISTLAALATFPSSGKVASMSGETLAKLVAQAKLQRKGVAAGKALAEILPVEPGRGFTLLPPPDAGDIFFDMEGDPLYPEGLEYLFGFWGPFDGAKASTFRAIWAHDPIEEKAAFEELMKLFTKHLRKFPNAHIYHYAQYEPSALRRLAMRYATMENELDALLRGQKFVDLYRVVRQAIRASTESYSLKDLEKIYWGKRSGEVTNAGDSIVEYERWRVTNDAMILHSIALYNEDDCVSTAKMRDWLEGLRPAAAVFGLSTPPEERDAAAEERAELRAEAEAKRQALAEAVRKSSNATPEVRELIAELLWFHKRTQKPQWWGIFDRQLWTVEEMIDDADGLGGLVMDGTQSQEKRSYVAKYKFPPQDTKLKVGSTCRIAETTEPAGTIEELDPDTGVVVLKRGTGKGDFPKKCCLSPGGPIEQDILEQGVAAFAQRFASGELDNDQALMDLLLRERPRIKKIKAGAPLVNDGENLLDGSVAVVTNMKSSTLFIQGPPGTGKTYTSSHAILALLKLGKRVAISSNSHKAINNLLKAVEARSVEQDFDFLGAKKGSRNDKETAFDGDFISTVWNSGDVSTEHRLVGATAFHFARPEEQNGYDYLFVDEAGQVALGNLIAMAGCAKNLVLVGDQMQLPQPVQGVHPGETGLSCLEYLLRDRATVPPDVGILLNVSHRMHPAICDVISDAIYDSRLTALEGNQKRLLVLANKHHPALKPAGITFIEVDHEGCLQSSMAEVEVVNDLVSELLKQKVQDTKGKVHPIKLSDILIVAPFNMQVDLLKRHLPEDARIGTVDKFQGQEAAVAIISMSTSCGDDAPRGTAFLFNRNRFNVAISRAQSLAIVVHGPKLLDASCSTIDDLIRINLFAWVENKASRHLWDES